MTNIEENAIPDLVQAIYVSAARKEMNEAELAEILAKARRKNEGCGVTGMLLYNAGSFIQILEGPEVPIRELVGVIKQDQRHHNFKLLFEDRVDERDFENWSMGFVDMTGLVSQFRGFVDYQSFANNGFTDGKLARKVLKQFKDGTWRQYSAA